MLAVAAVYDRRIALRYVTTAVIDRRYRRMNRLEPQTGSAFEMRAGQLLRVIDLEGEQVADLIAFNLSEKAEWLSSGRSIDYANRIYLTKGDLLYSNRSRPMFIILEDDVGRHDF